MIKWPLAVERRRTEHRHIACAAIGHPCPVFRIHRSKTPLAAQIKKSVFRFPAELYLDLDAMFDKALTKTVAGDYDRKWLSDDYFDLIVWYTSTGAVHGFQLCYEKPRWERALTWISTKGFSHMQVDDGEQNAWNDQTPILLPDGSFPADTVVAEFRRHGAELPNELRDLVLQKIDEYVRTRKT